MRVESPAMSGLEIRKTYKLYLGGEFVRSESGHYEEARDARGRHRANVCRASRKDLRDAVTKARAASGKWAGSSGYLRGQILYRLAEMMESRVPAFEEALRASGSSAAVARPEGCAGERRSRTSNSGHAPAPARGP